MDAVDVNELLEKVGGLENLVKEMSLPKVGPKTTHQRAMAHGEVHAAVGKVRNCNALSSTKLAFEFPVLTACRS